MFAHIYCKFFSLTRLIVRYVYLISQEVIIAVISDIFPHKLVSDQHSIIQSMDWLDNYPNYKFGH